MITATPPRGLFIVMEGIDRSGKSTQVELLHNHFPASTSVMKSALDRKSVTGKKIASYLNGTIEEKLGLGEVEKLFSDNRREQVEEILSLIKQGTHVIMDRWSASGIVYAEATANIERSISQANERGLPKPDVVFFMRLDPVIAAKRSEYGSERYEKLEIQTKVDALFHTILDESWVIIDATQSKEVIHACIVEHLDMYKEGYSRAYSKRSVLYQPLKSY